MLQTRMRAPMLDVSACSCLLALQSLTTFCFCNSSFSRLLAADASSALRFSTAAWFTCFLSSRAISAKCLRSYIGIHPHTHTPSFNGPLSRTTRVSRYQKGKTNLDLTEARDSEWQWHQLGHMQVCTSLQTDNHANTPPLKFFTGRMPFLPPNQQHQSTEGTPASIHTEKKLTKLQ